MQIKHIENLLNDKLDNLYVYTRFVVDTETGFSMNTNSKIKSSILNELCIVIDNLNTKNIILVCRSEREPFTHEHPTEKEIKHIKSNTNKNIKVFYQNPWPEPVPLFIESNTSVIRFGFDEGCKLDNKCVDKEFSVPMEIGEHIFLINKNKSIALNSKKNII